MTWARALAWRLGRQLLDRSSPASVVDVVGRLGAVPAWPDITAELSVAARRRDGRHGDVARALGAGTLVKAYVFAGATHLMTPHGAGDYIALRASSRMWELPSWVRHYGLTPEDWPTFRAYVREALADGPLTRTELVAALGRSRRYRHLAGYVAEGNDTLLKPLTWQGDMGLGIGRDGEPAFVRLDRTPGWAGVPELDEAGPRVVETYFRTYGPGPVERVESWLGQGLGVKRRSVRRWIDGLGDRLVALTIEGETAFLLSGDVHDASTARPSNRFTTPWQEMIGAVLMAADPPAGRARSPCPRGRARRCWSPPRPRSSPSPTRPRRS